MINTNFDLILETTDDAGETTTETVKVTIQEISPFIYTNIMSSALNINNGAYQVGMLAELYIEKIVVSPKNLKECIEKADNALKAIASLTTEVKKFCECPRKYALIQKESEIKSKSLEPSNT